MKTKDENEWNAWVDANDDDRYGRCCVRYAEAWANEMERRMESGEKLEDVAKQAGHDANKDYGITGFMYGAAVEMLSQCWEHGEVLRQWSNLDLQINDEGEKANNGGGVLNPALMTIEVPARKNVRRA
jgi:hypothetical protein